MSAADKERRRCIQIVQEYRRELTSAYARKPDAPNADAVLTLIQRLQAMEQKNHATMIEPEFDLEDMELAEIIMDELK